MPEQFGPYLVYEQIGIGGMASVHRAETQGVAGFRKAVALKRMLPSVASDSSLVQSFIREARLASHLRHANVAQTYDLGKVGDTYFIAMELVPGRNLREILKRGAAIAGPMPLPLVLNILNQLCDALDYAHNLCDETGQPLGIIHRDVSPSNVIVSEGGVVKLIDFGIAKASAAGMQTMSGTIKGKFGYMAPEYIGGKIDARADLFAIGVVAHELLANRPLFSGKDDMDTLYNVKSMPILPPSKYRPDVPPEIDAIVMTALERDPDRRWQRANALRTALTTETRRLGLLALNQQVAEWVEWAFSQHRRRDDSEPEIAISQQTMSVVATGSAPGPSDSLPTMIRPSAQLPVPRGSAPQPVQHRPSQPYPAQTRPSQQHQATMMGLAPPSTIPPPLSPVPSGARTSPFASLQDRSVSGVLRELDETSGGESIATTKLSPRKPRRGRGLLFALLVLAVAGATAAAVYFALPYFT